MNRRSLLKLGTSAALALPFISANPVFGKTASSAPASKGRVNWAVWVVRATPSFDAKIVKWTRFDDVIPLTGQLNGPAWGAHKNPIWYETEGGYIHSAQVQPVEDIATGIENSETASGRFLAEVTRPIVDLHIKPSTASYRPHRLYYGCTFRVIGLERDSSGQYWYQLSDGVQGGGYALATGLRRVAAEELTPLSPSVQNKSVVVDMVRSVVTAYEDNRAVYEAACTTGTRKFGQLTPGGEHRVLYKNAATHMRGDLDRPADRYDLPGVAYSTFFTVYGVALHGTFWHNDWGARRSHGCVNMRNSDAKWFYRWTAPSAPYESSWYFAKYGVATTPVTVKY